MAQCLMVGDGFDKIFGECVSWVFVMPMLGIQLQALLMPCGDSNVVGGFRINLVHSVDSQWLLLLSA